MDPGPATPSFTDSPIIFSAKQATDSTGVPSPVIGGNPSLFVAASIYGAFYE